MPDVFEFSAQVDRPTVPADAEAELKLHLEVQSVPGLVIPPTKAMTTNICLVFDCSGSMAGAKREAAIEAAKMIVDTVSEQHRLSLVGFATNAKVMVGNAQPSKQGKDAVKAKIDKGIRGFPRGTTNLAAGLTKATAVLEKQKADARVMIILSDGGADSEKKAQAAGAVATQARIQLFAVGIGDDYDADSLLKLVTPSNGAMFGESDLERVKATFEMLIGRIGSFVGTNAALELKLGPGIKPGTAYKSSPDQAVIGKLSAKLHVGNVEKDQKYGFVVTMTAPARGAGRFELMRATLHFDAPAFGQKAQKLERVLALEYVRGAGTQQNAQVVAAYRAVEFVELADAFANAHRRGDTAAAVAALQGLIKRAEALGDAEAKVFYADVLEELHERGRISQERLNALVLGGTQLMRKKKPGPKLYDVVLVEPGKELITVIRELRRITGRELRQVADLVNAAPRTIRVLPLAEARELKKELAGLGAKIDVRVRAG